jgi:hypothetical protein
MEVLETKYNGILFRSRLEARWAVLFNALGIDYVYEPECFILKNGLKYTPDFYLPNYDLYIEIKPDFEWLNNEYHFGRYELFNKTLLVLSGSFPTFCTNRIYNFGAVENVVFIPIFNQKYDNFWCSGFELGSLEDNYNECYKKELDIVKNYRFYK